MRNDANNTQTNVLITKKIVAIGLKIRKRRKELDLTLFNLAVDSECSISVISELERGLASGMTLCTIIKIASALEISPEELFCE